MSPFYWGVLAGWSGAMLGVGIFSLWRQWREGRLSKAMRKYPGASPATALFMDSHGWPSPHDSPKGES